MIQRQMCTSHSSKVEHEWHLFLFLWPSSLSIISIEGRFSVQCEMAIIRMGLPKDLVRRGATALPPDWTSFRIKPPLQNVFLQLFARLNVNLKWKFRAGRIQIRRLVPHFDIENVIGKGTVQD
jgi:hypothetical protein